MNVILTGGYICPFDYKCLLFLPELFAKRPLFSKKLIKLVIKSKLTHLISKTFARKKKLVIACNAELAFFTNDTVKHYTVWTCLDVCESLSFLFDNSYVRIGDAVYRQVIDIQMGTNCAPLVADLFLYCYERDFMLTIDNWCFFCLTTPHCSEGVNFSRSRRVRV